MKIYNLKDFLKLPSGTLYSQYGPLCVKGETIEGSDDFFYDQLTGLPSLNENFDVGETRWGEFDIEVEFVVYDKKDIHDLILRLSVVYGCHPHEI